MESCTYTYLLADAETKEAVLIDPVLETVDGTLNSLMTNTHYHADHITGSGLLKQKMFGLKSAISKHSGATADIDGDTISFGKHAVLRNCINLSIRGFSLYLDIVFSTRDMTIKDRLSTVDEETKFNPRLTKPLDEFVKIMNNLNLPKPAKIVPANLVCGLHDV